MVRCAQFEVCDAIVRSHEHQVDANVGRDVPVAHDPGAGSGNGFHRGVGERPESLRVRHRRRHLLAVRIEGQRQVDILVVREQASVAMDRQQRAADEMERDARRIQRIACGEQHRAHPGAGRIVLRRIARLRRHRRLPQRIRQAGREQRQGSQRMPTNRHRFRRPLQPAGDRQLLLQAPTAGVVRRGPFQHLARLRQLRHRTQHPCVVQRRDFLPGAQFNRLVHGHRAIALSTQAPAGHAEVDPGPGVRLALLQRTPCVLQRTTRVPQHDAQRSQVGQALHALQWQCTRFPVGAFGGRLVTGRERPRCRHDATGPSLGRWRHLHFQLQLAHSTTPSWNRIGASPRAGESLPRA